MMIQTASRSDQKQPRTYPNQQPTKNVDTTKTITHVSLCSGYGGIDLGLRAALPALRTIAYCEREAFPISILLRRIEEGQLDAGPIHTDLKAFPWELFRDRVGILSGGYPCQPFSAAGNRLGKDDPRHLWPWIREGIAVMRPSQCFFENVDGHISMGLSTVIGDLEELGYKATWGVFSASEVGAPHQRKRVFILADRIGAGSQGRLLRWANPERQGIDGHAGRSGSGILRRWPSRPGETQYGWEPPRVVENTKLLGRGGRNHGDAPRDGGEIQAEGSRPCKVGNPLGLRLESTGDQGAVGEASGNASGEGSQPSLAPQVSSDSSGQPVGNSECGGLQGGYIDRAQAEELGSGRDLKSPELGNSQHAGSHGTPFAGSIASTGNYDPSGEDIPSQPPGASRSSLGGDLSDQDRSGETEDHPQAESTICGSFDGATDRVGYAELCKTYLNRNHELRALGNGVVPPQCTHAYRTLVSQLVEDSNLLTPLLK